MMSCARLSQAAALVAALACGMAAAPAAAQTTGQRPTVARPTPVTYTGTVTQIDYVTRIISTRGIDGQVSVFEAPPSLPQAQLTAIRVGDAVRVQFMEGIGIRRKPAGEPPIEPTFDAATGMRVATVNIVSANPAARTVTFIGPRGRYTRAAGDADPGVLQAVAPGERADMAFYEYVENIAVVREVAQATAAPPPPPPALPPPAEPEHRWSIWGVWGWDNQFAGKVITAAAGTFNGQPIAFSETTYDDVYGRMGLFKVGMGYQVTRNSDLTVGFVVSDSASTPVQVATIGSQAAAVTAAFDDYSYWGFEVGQRFYFPVGNPAGRFTPFAGYYAGLNRFTKINGDFVARGNEGLIAVQDGQFFDASWAFSFGGAGGVLIALAPRFEVMAQAELRYMGGLSDVDPLSQAGLKDVNSESSRWSVPFLFGARYRF